MSAMSTCEHCKKSDYVKKSLLDASYDKLIMSRTDLKVAVFVQLFSAYQ